MNTEETTLLQAYVDAAREWRLNPTEDTDWATRVAYAKWVDYWGGPVQRPITSTEERGS